MLDLNLIQTFTEVIKAKSVSLAAKRLFATQPTISQRIKTLEGQVGKSLFLRKRSGMELNAAGKEFYEICQEMNAGVSKIDDWIMAGKGKISGEVTISAIPGFANHVLPDCIAGFMKKYPDIILNIREELSADTEELVLKGEADLGIIVGRCQKESLKMLRVISNNCVLMVCSPQYFLAKKKKITPSDMEKADIIWHAEKGSRTRKLICDRLGLDHTEKVGSLRLPDMEACRHYALRGLGVTFLANLYTQGDLKLKKLVALPGFRIKRAVSFISRNDKYETPAVSAVKNEFADHCREWDKRLGEFE